MALMAAASVRDLRRWRHKPRPHGSARPFPWPQSGEEGIPTISSGSLMAMAGVTASPQCTFYLPGRVGDDAEAGNLRSVPAVVFTATRGRQGLMGLIPPS